MSDNEAGLSREEMLNYKKSYEGRYVFLYDEFSGYILGKVEEITSFLPGNMMTALLNEVLFISMVKDKFSVSNVVLSGVCYKEEFTFHRNNWFISYPHKMNKSFEEQENDILVFNDCPGGGIMFANEEIAEEKRILMAHTYLESKFQVKFKRDCIRVIDPRIISNKWEGLNNYVIDVQLKNLQAGDILDKIYSRIEKIEESRKEEKKILISHDSEMDFMFKFLLSNCEFPGNDILSEDNDDGNKNFHLLNKDFILDKEKIIEKRGLNRYNTIIKDGYMVDSLEKLKEYVEDNILHRISYIYLDALDDEGFNNLIKVINCRINILTKIIIHSELSESHLNCMIIAIEHNDCKLLREVLIGGVSYMHLIGR